MATALLAHGQRRAARTEEGTSQIYSDDLVKILITHFEQGAIAYDTRVVDHHINAAKFINASLDQRIAYRGFGDWARHGMHRDTEGRNFRRDRCQRDLVGAIDNQGCAFGSAGQGKVSTKAARWARNNNSLSIQPAHTPSLRFVGYFIALG
jgi:hypothetical protein